MQGASTAQSIMFQSYFNNAQISGLLSMFAMLPILLFTPFARKMVNKYGKKEMALNMRYQGELEERRKDNLY